MHVAGGDHGRPGAGGQLIQGVIALIVGRLVVAGQLDHDVLPAEHAGQRPSSAAAAPAGRGERRGDGALTAAREDHPVPAVRLRQRLQVVDGAALLTPGELRRADHLAQPPVPLRVPGQHQQVPAFGVGHPGPGGATAAGGRAQAELGAEDRADPGAALLPEPGGRLRELRHAVHAVVVGDGQRGQAEARRPRRPARRERKPRRGSCTTNGSAARPMPGRAAPRRPGPRRPGRRAGGSPGAAMAPAGRSPPAARRAEVPQDRRRSSSRHGTGGLSQPIRHLAMGLPSWAAGESRGWTEAMRIVPRGETGAVSHIWPRSASCPPARPPARPSRPR